MTDLERLIILTQARGIGPMMISELCQCYGSLESIFQADTLEDLRQRGCESVAQAIEEAWKTLNVDQIQIACEREGVIILSWLDQQYPSNLKEIHDPPPILYIKGKVELEDQFAVAVVGSRRPTIYGREQAFQLSSDLAANGFTVVSGLAKGIDAQAHRGALRSHGKTIAVLGCGIDVIYPKENEHLFQEIVEQGGVIMSEFPLGTRPLAAHFPRRNRIIAGLGLATLVVQANYRSGSLITARLAAEEGREVYALPGPVDAVQSGGSHRLIKEGAKLIESAQDILSDLQPSLSGWVKRPTASDDIEGSCDQRGLENMSLIEADILSHLKEMDLSADALIKLSVFPTGQLMQALTSLELKRKIFKRYGGIYGSSEL